MQVLVSTAPDEAQSVRSFLRRFECIGIDTAIAERAVELRQAKRLKLPDAIIRATAMQHSPLLVTRNTKDFPDDEPGIRVPCSF